MYWLVAVIVLVLAQAYVLGPLVIRRKFWMAADPQFGPLSADDPGTPVQVRAFWSTVTAPLRELGFACTGYLHNSNMMPDSESYLALFENRAATNRAAAIVIVTTSGGTQARRVYTLEFSSEFVDGTEINTNNGDVLPDISAPSWRSTARLPRLGDVRQLYRVHQTRSDRHARAKRALPSPAQQVASLRASLQREFQDRIDAGFWYRDEQQNQARLTWSGAVRQAWAFLWPAGAIRRQMMMRRARRLLQEAGLPTDYPTVDYERLVAQRAAELPPTTAETQSGPPLSDGEHRDLSMLPAGLHCANCNRPIIQPYWEVNGKVTCGDCRDVLAKPTAGGTRIGRTLRATIAGGLAGVFGAIIYYAVEEATGYEIGYVALVVGLLVGGAVRWGARARGGWYYQLLAISLTYAAVGLSQSAMVIREFARHPEWSHDESTTMPADDETGTLAESDSQPARAAAESQPTTQPVSAREALIALGALAVFVLSIPVLIGTHSPISLLITGIALYEAWKINKRPAQRVSGPHELAPEPAASPPANTEGDA